jgi:HSP20 family protein
MSLVKYRNSAQRNNNEKRSTQNYLPGFGLIPSLFEDWATPGWTRDLMQDFFDESKMAGSRLGTSLPAVNISGTADEVVIEMAAPGMKKKDFKVEIQNDQLHISYAKENEAGQKNDVNHWRREYNFESFGRTFTLPSTVESEKVNATYTDGILRIAVPKKEEARTKPARTIEIK